MPYSGVFPKKKDRLNYGELSLVICSNCKLVQLDKNFNSKKMYGYNYGYRTGLNPSMVNHMKAKANTLKKYLPENNRTILDIGSNDGTFLSFFSDGKSKLIGFDPTIKKFKKFYNKEIITISDFFNSKKFLSKSKKSADLITTNAMLYDLPKPKDFLMNIYNSLSKNGIWHTEQSYLKSMIEKNSYDTICHEHIEYYSLKSLKYLLDEIGFKIIEIGFNDVNGGSFALTLTKKDCDLYKEKKDKISKILNSEERFQLHKVKTYHKFYLKIKKESQKLKSFLEKQKNKNKLVLGYGASTKGNVILSFSDINSNLMPFVAEVNSFKFNKYVPGTEIKIISETKARKLKPDYFLVMPWHFKNFILKKEKKFIRKNSIKFVFPLPRLTIV
jgi:hypothetical protein